MRILWVSHFLPFPPRGGALQRSHHLLRQAAQRHEVHLVSLNQRAILPDQAAVSGAEQALRQIAASVATFPIPADAARVHWLGALIRGYLGPDPYDVTWLRSTPMRLHLEGLLAGVRFDLVHVDTIGLWPAVRAPCGVPVVLNHHNVESQMIARRAEGARWPGRVYFRRQAVLLQRIEAAACPRAAMNIAVSSLDAARLAAVAPGCRTHVVDNGVDTDYFVPGAASSAAPKTLVFAGRMSWYPNHGAALHLLREIWPALVAADPEYRLTIVGKDPAPEIARWPDSRVRVTGYVEDVRPYLDEAEIYVCPIRDGGGTRLKVLDALAMGKPLVATALAVEGLDLVEGTHFLAAENPADFVRQIMRLSRDPTLRERLCVEGRRLVGRRYSWQVLGSELDRAYQAALALRHAPPTVTAR